MTQQKSGDNPNTGSNSTCSHRALRKGTTSTAPALCLRFKVRSTPTWRASSEQWALTNSNLPTLCQLVSCINWRGTRNSEWDLSLLYAPVTKTFDFFNCPPYHPGCPHKAPLQSLTTKSPASKSSTWACWTVPEHQEGSRKLPTSLIT